MDTNKTPDLLPCPFCGWDKIHTFSHFVSTAEGHIEVLKAMCTACNAEAPKAIWNNRITMRNR